MSLPGKRMPRMLWRTLWRYAAQHRWQTVLSFVGIMLGVMMVVAVDLASNSARRAFDLSVETVSGSLTHQIVGGSEGVAESVYTSLRTELGIRRSAPSLSAEVRYKQQSLTVLGLDLISEGSLQRALPGIDSDPLSLTLMGAGVMREGNAVILSETVASELGLQLNDEFTLNPPNNALSLKLVAVLEDASAQSGQILFMDVALAQALLGRAGKLDSINLVLNDEEVEKIKAWLPAGVSLEQAAGRQASLEQMSEAFHVNLLAMSLLALLVAALLIYNTVSLSVLERRSSFGVLRALGVTSIQLRYLIIIESALLGALASIAGVVGGFYLGSKLVVLVTRTIDDLYFNLTVTQFTVEPLLLLKGFAWGLSITILAAALPAWQAGRSRPVTLQQKGTTGTAFLQRLPWLNISAACSIAAGLLLLSIGGGLVRGFVALNLLVFGFCLLVPQCMQVALALLSRLYLARNYLSFRLALRNIQSGLDRTALAVAALTVAVSVTVGVGIMVGSLRDTVILWLDQSLSGDVQVNYVEGRGGFSDTARELVLSTLGVERAESIYLMEAESSVGPLRVQAGSGDPADWLFLQEVADQKESSNDESVYVSESMAWQLGLSIGDSFQLLTAQGSVDLMVSGVFYDYTTGKPLISLTESQLKSFWPQIQAQRMAVYLEDDASLEVVTQALRTSFRALDESYLVIANQNIYQVTLGIFDRTFAITHVLRLLAIMVAFVGVFSAMLALQLQQMRDYAVLRAEGMTRGEVSRLILIQTLIMGVLAGLLALPLGMMMSEVLIKVINQRSFGWSMQHSLPLSVLAQALILAVLAAVLSGLYPARRVAKISPAEALREA